MGLFCRKSNFAVCQECGVHFEPHTDGLGVREYCRQHRAARLEVLVRQGRVLTWCAENWRLVEPQMLEQEKSRRQACQGLAAGMAAADSGSFGEVLGMMNQSSHRKP